MVDGVEQDEPEEFPDRHLQDHLAAREELALAFPGRVVESGHLAVQLVPVLLEGGGRFRDAADRLRFPLPAAGGGELAAGGVLEHQRGEELGGGRRSLVRLVVETALRKGTDHAQEGGLLRLAPNLEELTLVHACSGLLSQGGTHASPRWAFATPPETPLATRRRYAAPPRSTWPLAPPRGLRLAAACASFR